MGGDRGKGAARAERSGAFADADVRIDPVKGGRGHYCVEWVLRKWPVLERRDDDLDGGEAGQLVSSDRRQLRPQLDGHDPVATLGERQRCLSGPAADLQHPCTRYEVRIRGEIVKNSRGIGRPRPLIPLRIFGKSRAQVMSVVRHQS